MAGIRKGREFRRETARKGEGSTAWHDIFEGGYFYVLAMFCILWELMFAIRTSLFFSCWELIFAIFRKYPVPSIINISVFCFFFVFFGVRAIEKHLFKQ